MRNRKSFAITAGVIAILYTTYRVHGGERPGIISDPLLQMGWYTLLLVAFATWDDQRQSWLPGILQLIYLLLLVGLLIHGIIVMGLHVETAVAVLITVGVIYVSNFWKPVGRLRPTAQNGGRNSEVTSGG